MKATIEVPDELYRRVKAKAAMEGRAIREVTMELYQKWLGESSAEAGEDQIRSVLNEVPVVRQPTLHDRFRKYCGVGKSGVGDLSTNPKHMEGFGED